MRILLDTHAALWWWEDNPKLSVPARNAISDPTNQTYFSAISAYEIFQKVRLGKLEIPSFLSSDILKAIKEEGWLHLSLQASESVYAAKISHPHKDPFDRLLAGQSALNEMKLITVDPAFTAIGTDILW